MIYTSHSFRCSGSPPSGIFYTFPSSLHLSFLRLLQQLDPLTILQIVSSKVITQHHPQILCYFKVSSKVVLSDYCPARFDFNRKGRKTSPKIGLGLS